MGGAVRGLSSESWVQVVLISVVPLGVSWRSGPALHTGLEVAGTALLLLAGVCSLRDAYHGGPRWRLTLGTGLWVTAGLDACHAAVTSAWLAPLFPGQSALIAWSWLASRLSLGGVLLWTAASLDAQARGESLRADRWPALAIGALLSGFAVLLVAPLPPAYTARCPLGRPQELLPAALFLLALLRLRRAAALGGDPFAVWLARALVFSVGSQVFLMTRSRAVFDAPFDLGHMTKLVGYACLVAGLARAVEPARASEVAVDETGTRRLGLGLVLVCVAILALKPAGSLVRSAWAEQLVGSAATINAGGRQRYLLTRGQLLLERVARGEPAQAELAALAVELGQNTDAIAAAGGLLAEADPGGAAAAASAAAGLRAELQAQAGAPDPATAAALAARSGALVQDYERLVSRGVRWAAARRQHVERLDVLLVAAHSLLVLALGVFGIWPLLVRVRAHVGALRRARDEAEARRSASDEELRQLFALSRDMICVADLAGGRFLRVNPAFERVLGFSRAELLATPLLDLVHPEDRAATEAEIARLRAGQSAIALENRCRTRAGGWRRLAWSAAPGQERRAYSVARDVTEEHAAQASLLRHAQELERSNQALDEFAYVASHDLRAPLRDIDNLSSWLLEDARGQLPPASARHLAQLRGRVERMERLLEDLLLYSRAGRRYEPAARVDLHELLLDMQPLLALPPGMRLELPAAAPTVRTPRAPLEVVLRNLITNAWRHHDRPEGTIAVDVVELDADTVEFSVRDDGPGIPPQFHERVFRLFQGLRPRDQLETSGMGLAIVKKWVEAHGGRITLESPEGARGCCFRFTWPRDWRPPLADVPEQLEEVQA